MANPFNAFKLAVEVPSPQTKIFMGISHVGPQLVCEGTGLLFGIEFFPCKLQAGFYSCAVSRTSIVVPVF